MKTLKEFNLAKAYGANTPTNPSSSARNGLACDNCGEELFDTHQGVTLTSDPPQKEVHCEGCLFRGYRYV